MTPFGFVLTLVSFIYALAMTHLLMGAARMVRHRAGLTFSWPHALWMAFIFVDLLINWISFWDARAMAAIDLGSFVGIVALATTNYLAAALVTPEFEQAADYDLARFHEQQSRTYLTALLAFTAMAFVVNVLGALEGFGAWPQQNIFVVGMSLIIAAALFMPKSRFVQMAAPLAMLALIFWFALAFYPKGIA